MLSLLVNFLSKCIKGRTNYGGGGKRLVIINHNNYSPKLHPFFCMWGGNQSASLATISTFVIRYLLIEYVILLKEFILIIKSFKLIIFRIAGEKTTTTIRNALPQHALSGASSRGSGENDAAC